MSKITRKEFVKGLSQPDTLIDMIIPQHIHKDDWRKFKAVFNLLGYEKPFDFIGVNPITHQFSVRPGVVLFKGGTWYSTPLGYMTFDCHTRRGVNFEFYRHGDCFLAGEKDGDCIVARVFRVQGE